MGILTAEGAFKPSKKDRTIRRRNRNILGFRSLFFYSVVYRELRGFDDFFAHQEEIDLCWRAINKGYSIKYNYKSTVYHVGGATLQQGNPKKTFLNFRNSLLMLTKNVPKDNLMYFI
jgi:GT2 family glycosyltransferase